MVVSLVLNPCFLSVQASLYPALLSTKLGKAMPRVHLLLMPRRSRTYSRGEATAADLQPGVYSGRTSYFVPSPQMPVTQTKGGRRKWYSITSSNGGAMLDFWPMVAAGPFRQGDSRGGPDRPDKESPNFEISGANGRLDKLNMVRSRSVAELGEAVKVVKPTQCLGLLIYQEP
jgi:hypothetical protein